MATQADVRRIALSLPETEEAEGRFAFSVRTKTKPRGYAWVWMERVDPKKARVPNHDVLAVRVPNVAQRDLLISTNPDRFFTEPHYNGFPAVLVRLRAISVSDLRPLLVGAWETQAPRELLASPENTTRPRAKRLPAKRTAAKRAAKKRR